MDLDKMFEVIVSWQTMFICLGTFLFVFAIRRVLETALGDKLKGNKWWNEVALPLSPIVVGAIIGVLAKSFPWPVVVGDNIWARVMYGSICGLSSGWVYSRFRSIMKTWSGTTDNGSEITPPVMVSLSPAPLATDSEPSEAPKTPEPPAG